MIYVIAWLLIGFCSFLGLEISEGYGFPSFSDFEDFKLYGAAAAFGPLTLVFVLLIIMSR